MPSHHIKRDIEHKVISQNRIQDVVVYESGQQETSSVALDESAGQLRVKL